MFDTNQLSVFSKLQMHRWSVNLNVSSLLVPGLHSMSRWVWFGFVLPADKLTTSADGESSFCESPTTIMYDDDIMLLESVTQLFGVTSFHVSSFTGSREPLQENLNDNTRRRLSR